MNIIVDTNIVFSALLNSSSRIGKILLHSKRHLQFFSCHYLQTEIQRHWPRLLKLTKLTTEDLSELEKLVTQHITFIDERLLSSSLLLETEQLLTSIDLNDIPFVALTKQLNGRLWTGDMQLYNGLKAKGFKVIVTTAELSLLINELEQ